jgi:hypothetical protein
MLFFTTLALAVNQLFTVSLYFVNYTDSIFPEISFLFLILFLLSMFLPSFLSLFVCLVVLMISGVPSA